jgi:hypothetical protein
MKFKRDQNVTEKSLHLYKQKQNFTKNCESG